MGLISRAREALTPTGMQDMLEIVTESFHDLSLRVEDQGWKKIGQDDDHMTRDALITAARDGRVLAVAHPLVRRGLSLRTAYVHGQGGPQVTVETGGDQDVNRVVQDWWEARANQAALTGPEARARLERALSTDGNVFIACPTNPRTGTVQSRTIPFEQITRIITNPDDRLQPWFYERTYSHRPDPFQETEETVTVYHPDIAYSPVSRPRTIGGHRVRWDQPVRHVKVNDLDGWQYGIGDTFSIAPYARAYRDFLTDWARLMRSLSQFAWRSTADGKRAARMRQALARIPNSTPPGNDGGAGASMVLGTGESLEAIPKTGATIDAESGRPLLAMIAAGLDVPVTMLSTDPGITGARSTAETLDEPMYLSMRARQDVWAAVYTDIAEYAIEQAIRAGTLQGVIVRDDWTDTDHAELDGETPVIHCDWPDLSTMSVDDMVRAVTMADGTGKVPPLVILRLLLTALSVDDIDGVIEEVTDEEGNWRDPYATAGGALMAAFQRGEDPAQALGQYRRFGDPDPEALS